MDVQAITYNAGGVFRGGKGSAPCPICQTERRRDQSALSIAEVGGKILLYCFKSRCSFVSISNALSLPLGEVQVDMVAAREAAQKQATYAADKLAKARSLWDAAKPIAGSKAEIYLRGRGITVPLPDHLRFMPDIFHGPSASWVTAMVANVEPTGGVHRTFFDKQGVRLPKNAKMMLARCAGGAVHLSEGAGPLVIAEGIETALSLVQLLGERQPTVWAALSTSGMKALKLPIDTRELIVATDGEEAGRDAGNRLASSATALGWNVSLLPAPDGQDWNDVLQAGGVAA